MLAPQRDLVAADADVGVGEPTFDLAEVLIARAEQRCHQVRAGNDDGGRGVGRRHAHRRPRAALIAPHGSACHVVTCATNLEEIPTEPMSQRPIDLRRSRPGIAPRRFPETERTMDRALTTMSWVWATLAIVALAAVPFTGTTGRLAAIGIAAVVCVCASYVGWQIHGVSPLYPVVMLASARVPVHVRPARSRRRHGRRQHERSDDRRARQLGARRRRGARGAGPPWRLFASRCRRRPDGPAGRDGRRVDRDRQPADRAARPQRAERDPQRPVTSVLGDPRRVDRGAARQWSRAEPVDRVARRRRSRSTSSPT